MTTVPDNDRRRRRLGALREHERRMRSRILAAFPDERAAIGRWRRDLPVALILGGPRSGTSAFRATLASHAEVLAPAGEHRLFFTLLGMNFPDGDPTREASDRALPLEVVEELLEMILVSSFNGAEMVDPGDAEAMRYAMDWAYRLPLQWTSIAFDADQVVSLVGMAVADYRALPARDLAQLDRLVFERLRTAYPGIDVQYYDGHTTEGGSGPTWSPSVRDMFDPIVEITPFVVPRPRALKTAEARVRLLLLKASSDPYRIAALRSLFSHRRTHVLRLKRNPLAAINGLIDGWAHTCFWQHDLSGDLGADHPFSGWCFDLVSGWRNLSRNSTVLSVAAQQWMESNRLIAAATRSRPPHELWSEFAFEDFIRSADSRGAILSEALGGVGLVPDDGLRRTAAAPPSVNQTRPSGPGRWRRRADQLIGLLDDEGIAETAVEMGYSRSRIEEWI